MNDSIKILFISLTVSLIGQTTKETLPDDADSYAEIPSQILEGQEFVNTAPVNTYQSPVSNLGFDPRVDVQVRNIAEAQGDICIRGGIFESTGFQIGALTLIDPQTGHYSAELPIAPEMLELPKVFTSTKNALQGFNSTVGTIKYDWKSMEEGGIVTIGIGDNQLNFQRFHQSWVQPIKGTSDWNWGYETELSRSKSDGTIPDSDHHFNRFSNRVQLTGPHSQTDFFAGYQSKFFGLFGMYTGENYIDHNPYETENVKTRLFMINHQQYYGSDSHWELATAYRRHSDHYIFNRNSPNNDFIHETDFTSLALQGAHVFNSQWSLHYSSQFSGDEIESTKLEVGKFTSRNYYKLSLLPEYIYPLKENKFLSIQVGTTLDYSNRDGSVLSPIAEISYLENKGTGTANRYYLSYAQTTQLAGYGAIGGKESGLFASNHDLGRETSRNLEIGYEVKNHQWSLKGAIFYRKDDDMVDWTYQQGSTSARTAENVSIDTIGSEIVGKKSWNQFEAIASYSSLVKKEDYGNDAVIGSFYALNFPKHRATLGFLWNLENGFEIRCDNEWRLQEDNPIRVNGPDYGVTTVLGISYYSPRNPRLELFAKVEKPWDDSFQEIPGTPGNSDQFSFGSSFRW